MAQRRFLGDPSDLRSMLDRRGDVEIGAWVRRRRRKRLLVAAAGLLLVVMAGVVYSWLRVESGLEQHEGYLAEFQCITCGEEFESRVAFNRPATLECPKCGELSAKEVWVCHPEGHRFVPPGAIDLKRLVCTECGSRSVGSAAADKLAEGDGQP